MSILNGSTGADVVVGTDEADTIYPMGGADNVDAGAGNDWIYLVEGDGSLSWGATYDGGTGFDTLDARSADRSVRLVSAGLPTFGIPVTTISNIEQILTGDGSDIVAMLSATQSLTIETGGGNDILTGGFGDDLLDGGSGKDATVYIAMYRAASISGQGDIQTITSPMGGTDTLKSIEYVVFKDGMFITDPDSAAGKTVRLYNALFDRNPSSIELDKAVNLQTNGMTLDRVFAKIAGETDAYGINGLSANQDFVDSLYSGILGRAGDEGGRSYWTSLLNDGLPRATVMMHFVESDEYRGIAANQMTSGFFVTDEASQYVAALYHAMAGRLPEEAGFTYWVVQLKTGMLTAGDVALGFAASQEWHDLTDGLSNADLVDYMYSTALHRSADAGGRAAWIAALDNGLSDANLIHGFATADEHLALIAPNITGGIHFAADLFTGW